MQPVTDGHCFARQQRRLHPGAPDLRGDISGNTIHLRVRGNAERDFVHLRSVHSARPWQIYRAGFEAPDAWRHVMLPPSAFDASRENLPPRVAAGNVRSLGIVAHGRNHAADLSISHLGV